MCCLFNFMQYLLGFFHKFVTAAICCALSCAVCCVMLFAVTAGVALGYNYSVSEYMEHKDTNVSVQLQRGIFEKHDQESRRAGGGDVGPDESEPVARRSQSQDRVQQLDAAEGYEQKLQELTSEPYIFTEPDYVDKNPSKEFHSYDDKSVLRILSNQLKTASPREMINMIIENLTKNNKTLKQPIVLRNNNEIADTTDRVTEGSPVLETVTEKKYADLSPTWRQQHADITESSDESMSEESSSLERKRNILKKVIITRKKTNYTVQTTNSAVNVTPTIPYWFKHYNVHEGKGEPTGNVKKKLNKEQDGLERLSRDLRINAQDNKKFVENKEEESLPESPADDEYNDSDDEKPTNYIPVRRKRNIILHAIKAF